MAEDLSRSTERYPAPHTIVDPASLHGDRDSLYIGDDKSQADPNDPPQTSAVRRFDADTGRYQGDFVAPASGGLTGPRGLVFARGELYVVNQNVDTPYYGEVLRFGGRTGAFLGKLVAHNDAHAPFSPRGIVRGFDGTMYVANYELEAGFSSGNGWIGQFDSRTGKFIRVLDTKGFAAGFWPRAIVFGPDGMLYASVTGNRDYDALTGYIVRFDPFTGRYAGTVAYFDASTGRASDHGCARYLHRPEGLVFGPDNRLYVTAFRQDSSDTDKILVFEAHTGRCVDHIDLAPSEASGGTRVYGEALLFGPRGRLFFSSVNTGEIRRYDVHRKTYDVFVPACTSSECLLKTPWYMTFGRTDPSTLAYDE